MTEDCLQGAEPPFGFSGLERSDVASSCSYESDVWDESLSSWGFNNFDSTTFSWIEAEC